MIDAVCIGIDPRELTRTRNGSGLLFSLASSSSSSPCRCSSSSLRISLKSVAGLFSPVDADDSLPVRVVRGRRGPPSQPAGTCNSKRQLSRLGETDCGSRRHVPFSNLPYAEPLELVYSCPELSRKRYFCESAS